MKDQKRDISIVIDLIAVKNAILKKFKLVIITALLFTLIGLLYALGRPNEYLSSTVLLVESNRAQGESGLIGQLGGLIGMDRQLGPNSSGILSPQLFPLILENKEIQKDLVEQKLDFEQFIEQLSFRQYFTAYHKNGFIYNSLNTARRFPIIVRGWFRPNSDRVGEPTKASSKYLFISSEENMLLANLSGRLSISFNPTDNLITLEVLMPDRIASVNLTKVVKEMLIDYLTQYKLQKSERKLLFISERVAEKKVTYEKISDELALFNDRNKNIVSERVINEKEFLNRKVNIAQELYLDLAKQLEQAKIELQDETPVFTTIQPASVPINKEEPKRTLIVLMSFFSGLILSLVIVLSKFYWHEYVINDAQQK